MREKMTTQEEQAMNIIWKTGEVNVKTILQHLPPPRPPYTTLASTIKNLEKKGYVKSRQLGNMYLYSPSVGESVYKKQTLTRLVKEHFDNSYKNLVAFFAEEKKVSASDLKEIINLIEGKTK